MRERRILGLVGGDPATALSGVARHLFDAIGRRHRVVARLDYSPDGLTRLALAARTFRPRRFDWRSAFHNSLATHRALENVLATRGKELAGTFDLALQVHGWVTGQPRPYAVFVDQTRLMADRGWPGWLVLRSSERSELLRLEREMYANAHHLFTMGEVARASLVRDYGIDPKRATVVGGGPNFDRLPPPTGPGPGQDILFVGRDFERKGGDCLLEAFSQVRARFPDTTLHVVGVERRFGIAGIEAHGNIRNREQLAGLYRMARVFCLPSRYEPYGLVLLEAMAHGVPCIGTRVQAIPEILNHGSAGLLVEPNDSRALADALIGVLANDNLATTLGRAGRRFVETELTWDRVADRMGPAIVGTRR